MMACSRPGCSARAVAQLVYAYAASQVNVTALDAEPDPNTYALCQAHLDKLTVPKGWSLTRSGAVGAAPLSGRQLADLAQRVRRAGGLGDEGEPAGQEETISRRADLILLGRRAHLRVVADAADYGSRRRAA